MNPDENNNLPNGPARPDVNAENLAAALDNLTAAGRAMGDGMSMPNLTENPTAAMPVPPAEDAPLVPAAPVPGSIGSVMSVPAEDINQDAMMDNPLMNEPSAPNPNMRPMTGGPLPNPVQPPMPGQPQPPMSPLEMANQSPAAPNPNPFAPHPPEGATVPGAGMPPVAPEANNPGMPPRENMAGPMNGAPAPNPAPAGFTPYNPFAPTDNNPTMPPVQPNAAKPEVKPKAAKGGGSVLPWILMGLFLLTTIVFGVLYVMEVTKEPQVVYKPMPTEDEESSATVSIMSCSRSMEGAVISEGITALSGFQDVTLNFKDNELSKITIKTESTYADPANPAEPVTSNGELSAEANELSAEMAPGFLLTAGEDGTVNKDKEALRAAYTSQGFFCQDE